MDERSYRNIFASRVFRDVADQDYIAARTLFRNDCYDEFLIFSQQCIEKYLKGILLYNNIPNKSMHSLLKLIEKCETIDHVKINPRSKKFIDQIDGYDHLRYAIYVFGAFSAEREYLIELDYAVMDIRRYCSSDLQLTCALANLSEDDLIKYTKQGAFNFGLLKDIQNSGDRKYAVLHPNLVWKNLFFSKNHRKFEFASGWWGKGSGLSPDSIRKSYDAVKDYVYLPKIVHQYFNAN
jgi:HEPN domain-containing protein